MPVYRKRIPRKTYRRRKTVRKARIARSSALGTKVSSIARTFKAGEINVVSTGDTKGVLTFSLNQCPDATDFTNLFDQFRIMAVAVTFVPTFTGSDMNPSSSTPILQPLYTCIDYDDNTSATNEDYMLCKDTMKMTRGHLTHRRYFVPCVNAETYKTAVTTGYATKKKQWLDCTDSTIPHFGLKYFIEANNITATTLKYKIYAKLYMQFRGVQ